jgi:hypothetical protein
MELSAHLLTLNEPAAFNAYTLRNSILEQYPDSLISGYIDGNQRRQVIYPRVHFTIENNKPIIISMNDGIDAARQFVENLKMLNVNGRSWDIKAIDVIEDKTTFTKTDTKHHYRFLTPWGGLNRQNLIKYKYLYASERTGFLNKMLMQNIQFLMQEFGHTPSFKITCRIRMNGLTPEICPETHMGFFTGSFQTNVYLPSYLGMGCGISRGFGTILPSTSPQFDQNNRNGDYLSV